MKIEVNEAHNFVLTEVSGRVIFETPGGNRIGISIDDDTFDISVLPKGAKRLVWYRVDMTVNAIRART